VNWAGLIFGAGAALALSGGVAAAFSRGARQAVFALAAAMFGVAGMCLALGNDFMAIAVLTVLGAGVPSMLFTAILLAPPAEPDRRPGAGRGASVAALAVLAALALATLLTRTRWAPAAGQRRTQIEWLGSRLLTDHLLTFGVLALLLAAVALGAVALLRARRVGPR
jgi:NADH:ubiquinone oxidoreductase subunit 6 (subunit J)